MSQTPRAPMPVAVPAATTSALTLPPYAVILHNDDHNSMDHVVYALLACVPELAPEEAVEIMLAAHEEGRTRVIACPLERAELYRDRLEAQALTATIEKA